MDLVSSIIIAITVVVVIGYLVTRHVSMKGLPPSVPAVSLPILGHLLTIDIKDGPNQLQSWREQVGDIFRMHLGMKVCIVLNGYETIKEAFVKQADAFSSRPFFYLDWTLGMQNTGIALNSGLAWKTQRTTSIHILRNMGVGKNVLAEKIQEEVEKYLIELNKFEGKAKDIKFLTNMSTSNLICSVLVGHNFDYDDKTFQRIVELLTFIIENFISNGIQFIETFPILHYLPGDLFGVGEFNRARRELRDLFFDHFRSLQTESQEDPESYMADYINQISKNDESKTPNGLDEKNLLRCIEDLVSAATDTTATTIVWFVLFMIQNPKMQEKIFQEISDEIGTERTPTMQDKSRMIYLNAALMETQRLGNVLPTSIPHACAKTTTLNGFQIPEGATVIANMASVFTDKQVWGDDVHTFRPERFIDDMGKLIHKEELIPFGIGRRSCMGEAVAKMELFLYLASMFQRFKFIAPDPDNPPQIREAIGFVRTPGPYEVSIINRT